MKGRVEWRDIFIGMRVGVYIFVVGFGGGRRKRRIEEGGLYWVQVWTRGKIDKPSELMHK